jgi:hypothetical protein
MKSRMILLTILLVTLWGLAYAGSRGEIVLTDGSVIYGEILSVQNNVYTIQSSTMGVLTVDQSKIREIRFGSFSVDKAPASGLPQEGNHSEMQAIQKSLLGNEEILPIILGLQEDPAFQEILNDPSVMNLVLSGDIQSLMSNPKFLQILNHPKVKEIQNKMAKEQIK